METVRDKPLSDRHLQAACNVRHHSICLKYGATVQHDQQFEVVDATPQWSVAVSVESLSLQDLVWRVEASALIFTRVSV